MNRECKGKVTNNRGYELKMIERFILYSNYSQANVLKITSSSDSNIFMLISVALSTNL